MARDLDDNDERNTFGGIFNARLHDQRDNDDSMTGIYNSGGVFAFQDKAKIFSRIREIIWRPTRI